MAALKGIGQAVFVECDPLAVGSFARAIISLWAARIRDQNAASERHYDLRNYVAEAVETFQKYGDLTQKATVEAVDRLLGEAVQTDEGTATGLLPNLAYLVLMDQNELETELTRQASSQPKSSSIAGVD